MYIICRFIKLTARSSSIQLKYFGKIMWIKASNIKRKPIILRFSSIFFKYKNRYEGCYFHLFIDRQSRAFKRTVPG